MKLPINKEAPLKGFQNFAYPVSVLTLNNRALPWFYSQFIQLCCRPNFLEPSMMGRPELRLDFYFYDPLWHYPCLTTQHFDKLFIDKIINISQFIEENIKSGYYIHTHVDEFYIPQRNAYQKYNCIHDVMVTGYDKNEGNVFIYGYTITGGIEETKVPIKLFEKAYYSVIEKSDLLLCYKNNEKWNYSLDIDLIIDLLTDYRFSINTSSKLRMRESPVDSIFGMEIYKYLIKYFISLKKNEIFCDLRTLHVLWEHKKCMSARIKYINENTCISIPNDVINECLMIEKECLLTRNLLIKYQISNNKEIIDNIIKRVESISAQEKVMLDCLIPILKDLKDKLQ